ncbi:hypothetical protein QCE49_17990 [Caballeronia sp. LZ008]|uniref:hypothetical protein n=1 Tax=unclassified Caballeronia TaxID=2646786 RepID=UPI002027D97D|nr:MULTISPECIES: hypothetical protein [unclassified Caballeronia]MDR5795266.1 hypothetical protein [Caballeronia sp. LZ008]
MQQGFERIDDDHGPGKIADEHREESRDDMLRIALKIKPDVMQQRTGKRISDGEHHQSARRQIR